MSQNGCHLRPTPVKLIPTKWPPQGSAVHGHESSHKGGHHLPAVRRVARACVLAVSWRAAWVVEFEEWRKPNARQGRGGGQACREWMGRPEWLWRYVLAYASGQRSLWQESLSVGYRGNRKFNSDWCWCSIYFRWSIFWLWFFFTSFPPTPHPPCIPSYSGNM